MDDDRVARTLRRLDGWRERHRERGLLWRAGWVLLGFAVLATGLAMVVLPGPAVVVIPLGLAMLSFEFVWAERLLDAGLRGGTTAARRLRRRRVLLAAVGTALALVAAAATLIVLL